MSSYLYFAQLTGAKVNEVSLTEKQKKILAKRCGAFDAKLIHVVHTDSSERFAPVLQLVNENGQGLHWEQPIWAPSWKKKEGELTTLLGDF